MVVVNFVGNRTTVFHGILHGRKQYRPLYELLFSIVSTVWGEDNKKSKKRPCISTRCIICYAHNLDSGLSFQIGLYMGFLFL